MTFFNFLILLDIVAMASAQILLKKGVSALAVETFSLVTVWNLFLLVFKNIYVFSGLVLMGLGFILWLFILSRVNLSIIYPISASLTIALAVLGSMFLFKEVVGPGQIVGIIVVILGIFLIYKA